MNKKISILFTIPNFETAGSGREMLNIIDGLDKSIFQPIICVEKSGGNLYEEVRTKHTIIVQPFTVHNCKGIIDTIKESRRIADTFKRYSIDIWQSFNWSSDFSEALIARFANAKYVYVKKNMNWDRKAWKVKGFLSRAIVARNSTMLFTILKPPYLRTITHFIPGGVDVNKFSIEHTSAVRKKYSIADSATVVTCVAQIVRVKDQETLIKAISELPNIHLILAGAHRDGEYAEELQQLVKSLKLEQRVSWLGYVESVPELLAGSDIFVLPTTNIGGHEEGCPVALLEAMASKLPCIASNVAGNRDLIVTNKTGLLFKPGDIKELTACIVKYTANKEYATEMAANAQKHIIEDYTLDKEIEAFTAMYKKLLRIK